jgi:hypothetical protein
VLVATLPTVLILAIVKLYVPGVVGVGRYEQYMEALRKSGNSCGTVHPGLAPIAASAQ